MSWVWLRAAKYVMPLIGARKNYKVFDEDVRRNNFETVILRSSDRCSLRWTITEIRHDGYTAVNEYGFGFFEGYCYGFSGDMGSAVGLDVLKLN